MKLVVIESPYAGDVAMNEDYARACMADSLSRGEAPLASHLLYTQRGILNDSDPAERKLGMEAGFAWGLHADTVAVYTDLGISGGMLEGIVRAHTRGAHVEHRSLGITWAQDLGAQWSVTHSYSPKKNLGEQEMLRAAEFANTLLIENWAARRAANPGLSVSARAELKDGELLLSTSVADLRVDLVEHLAEYYAGISTELLEGEFGEWLAGSSSLMGGRIRS